MNGPSPSTPLIRSFAVAKRLGWSAANLEGAVRTLNRVEAWLTEHGTTLQTASTEDLNEYLGERLGEVSPNTVIVDQRQLRAFYKWAVEGDYPYVTTGNPARHTGTIKGEEPDPDRCPGIDEWQYRALLATCRPKGHKPGRGAKMINDLRDATIIALLWDTGMRRSELAALEYRNIDWDAATIHLARTKGRTRTRSRDVVVTDEAFDLLTRYVATKRGEHDGALFESTHLVAGTTRKAALKPQAVYLMLKRRAELANAGGGLPGKVHAPTHAFRRQATINDLDDGLSARAIQNQRGWTQDGRMLARYSKAAETRQAMDEVRAKRGRRHLRAVGD